jgi:arylsulfatase A-like enzyme
MTLLKFSGACCCLLLSAQMAYADAVRTPVNVLFVVVDDMNTDLGAYGHPLVKTPNIDRLAEQGVLFSRAYAQYPQCNQSRASMLTGLYPDQTRVLSLKEHFRDELPDVVTLPQLFRNHGYFTARVGKVFHQGVPDEIGTDGLDDPPSWDVRINPRGIDREVHDRIVSIVPPDQDNRKFGGVLSWLSLDSPKPHTDQLGADAAIRLIAEHHPARTGKPFFLALGFYRPHTPFVAPSSWFERYPLDKIEPIEVPPGDRENKPVAALADRKFQADMTDLQKREAIQGYYASISFVDAQLGRVLDAISDQGLADNTIVVFVSDHGYQLGLHGLWQKRDLFENTVRTPLLIVAPGQLAPGTRTDTLVELVDIFPTLARLAGLEAPGGQLQGLDLKAILDSDAPARKAAISQSWSAAYLVRPERRNMHIMGYTIRSPRYRYTEWADGDEGIELYDYLEDPNEFQNLAADDAHDEILLTMQSLLRERKKGFK